MKKLQHAIQRTIGRLIATTVLMGLSTSVLAESLSVQVSQARSDEGVVRCGLFNDVATWRKEDQAWRSVDASLHDAKAVCDFGSVPAGNYAIAVFHAEQGEANISYGFLGKPKQGVGFSNNPSITFGPPDFESALISVRTQPVVIPIQLKY